MIRTQGDLIKLHEWLAPLGWLYSLAVRLRNRCFDLGFLRSRSFDIPIISIGNITVGGSGKTPHTEYLVRLLQKEMQVGVLSRGYKRKSRGYVRAEQDTPMQDVGDEPYQMRQKFPRAYVAVDKNRCEGIDRMTTDEETNDVDVILLDDAFQHRYVKPGVNILLTDYHRLMIYDKVMPVGRLREPRSGKSRADIVIVTKCPKDLKPMEFRVLTKAMNLYPWQELYFTTIDYDPLRLVFGQGEKPLDDLRDVESVLLVTGIASPAQLENDLQPLCRSLSHLSFGDHHNFKAKDAERINAAFAKLKGPKLLITTEKDAVRLQQAEGLSEEVKGALYALPIRVSFMLDQQENFNTKIISYVRKNSRNSILVKTKDDNKSKDSHHSGDGSGTISFRDN